MRKEWRTRLQASLWVGGLAAAIVAAYAFGATRLMTFAPAPQKSGTNALTEMASSQDGYARAPLVIREAKAPEAKAREQSSEEGSPLPPWEPDPSAVADEPPDSWEHPLAAETIPQPSPHGGRVRSPADIGKVPPIATPPMALPGPPRTGEAFNPPPTSGDIYGNRLRSASARFAERGEIEPETSASEE